jgi:anaerobic selenocysteine-containing dehydrogenase
MTLHATACPLDCPDSCSLLVAVEDGRVVGLEGSRANPLTQGFICSKVRRFPEHLYGRARLLQPAVRSGPKGAGELRRVSWDEALELLVGRLRETRDRSGGEAILPLYYGGSNGLLTQDTTDTRLFHRLGASRLARTVCAAPSGRAYEGLYGRMPGVALEDYASARLIVVWGANPSVSGIHLVPIIKRAREAGARLVVVDPRRTPLAKRADLHLPVRPGADLVVALAVIRALFDSGRADARFLAAHTTGADELRRRAAPWTLERAAAEARVDVARLEELVELYASLSPAVIRCGWGPERNRNGGSATAAILALPAVAGKLGVRGGGFTLSSGAAHPTRSAAAEPPPATRVVNMNRVGEALLEMRDPRIELLFVYNANPLMTLPNQERVRRGLEREDLFTVVFEQVMTDTARYADLVLPATTFLEHDDLARGYGAQVLHRVAPIIDPVGEARSNLEVFAELLERLDLARPGEATTAAALTAQIVAPEVADRLARGEVLRPAGANGEGGPVQLVDVHPRTTDGRIHLVPEELDREAPHGLYAYQPDPASDRFPLTLISPATSRTISSSLGQLHRRQVALALHPDDAAVRGLVGVAEGGGLVRVYNDLGEVRCRLRLDADLEPGVALLPKGLWSHNTASGTTANAVSPDSLADLGGGACFNDARVEVEAAG